MYIPIYWLSYNFPLSLTAYSDLCVNDDSMIRCFYERGEGESRYENLTLARFDLEWILSETRD